MIIIRLKILDFKKSIISIKCLYKNIHDDFIYLINLISLRMQIIIHILEKP
jgi:hypothetical protein